MTLRRVALLLFVVVAPSAAAQVPKDTVTITVTKEGAPVPGQAVRIIGEPPGGGEITLGIGRTGEDGVATFTVEYRPGLLLRAIGTHDSVKYESPKISFGSNPNVGVALALTVFTRRDGATLADLSFGPGSHIIISMEEGALEITEVLLVVNSSQQTYAPEGGFEIPLPNGFEAVQGLGGQPIFAREHIGAAAPGPFIPGETTVQLKFDLPYREAHFEFSQRLTIPLTRSRLIIDESPGLRVVGDQVGPSEVRENDGRRLRIVELEPADGVIAFRLEGLPHRANSGRWVALALASSIFVGGIGLIAFGRRGDPLSLARQSAATDRDELLADLEQLERDRAAGDTDDADYTEDRAEILGRLAALLRILEQD